MYRFRREVGEKTLAQKASQWRNPWLFIRDIARSFRFRLPPQDSQAATNGVDKRVYAVHGEGHGDCSRLDSGSSCLSGVALPW